MFKATCTNWFCLRYYTVSINSWTYVGKYTPHHTNSTVDLYSIFNPVLRKHRSTHGLHSYFITAVELIASDADGKWGQRLSFTSVSLSIRWRNIAHYWQVKSHSTLVTREQREVMLGWPYGVLWSFDFYCSALHHLSGPSCPGHYQHC